MCTYFRRRGIGEAGIGSSEIEHGFEFKRSQIVKRSALVQVRCRENAELCLLVCQGVEHLCLYTRCWLVRLKIDLSSGAAGGVRRHCQPSVTSEKRSLLRSPGKVSWCKYRQYFEQICEGTRGVGDLEFTIRDAVVSIEDPWEFYTRNGSF